MANNWNKTGFLCPPSDLYLEMAAGEVEGHTAIYINGSNQAVGTSYETIWEEGGLYVFPPSASTMTVSSDDANDTSAGTGARTVLIQGLDTNYVEISETVTMDGTTAVTTSNSYLRINSLIVATAGTGETNAGSIFVGTGTVTAGKPAAVYGEIYTGDGITHEGIYTVPAGKSFYPVGFDFQVQSGKDAQLQIHTISSTGVRIVVNEYEVTNSVKFDPKALFKIGEKTDIEFRSKVSANSTDMKFFVTAILRDH